MPSQRHHEPGDLYVKLHVKFPDTLDQNKLHLLESVLPPRNPLEKFSKNTLLEEVELDTPDQRQRERASDEAMDEDEAEPRVQCSNQ
jgi:DnaJ homolog subfamily A member 2